MKLYKTGLLVGAFLTFFACQDIVDDINVDPNKIPDVNGEALFSGMQLADITAQNGFLGWASGVASGYFVGDGRLNAIQDYNYNNTDSDTPWRTIYVGVVKQARELRSGIPVTNQNFFYGASKVVEAHALATAASLFGDVPFSEAVNDNFPTPVYDGQLSVYSELQNLLDDAISDLQASGTSSGVNQDLFFDGDSNAWIEAAYSLKARLYLENRDYSNAVTAAQNGISSASNTMAYNPPNEEGGGDINLLNSLKTSGTFADDVTVGGSYLIELIGTGAESRNNTKTDEVDRAAYYYNGSVVNLEGFAAPDAPMNQISLEENLLTWAEALIRSGAGNFDAALTKLNEHRANLRNGVYFPVSTGVYDDYVSTDFEAGGIENADSALSREDALLREIIEERYASFFNQVIAFNDIRRMEKDPTAIQVSVPFNTGSQRPQRFLYPFEELNTNGENVPDIMDIFIKTPVNQ
jgi:hypothetical protein